MRSRSLLAAAAAFLLTTTGVDARAALAEVTVTDRVTGETLPVYWHRGERWIAGTPGNRYSVTVRNRGSGRLLAVLSVDGVNAISGETAAWDQSGYVLGPHQDAEIRGWRKSRERIAAFEFTALPDSYAARTGRPQHVGVIGVALFREAPPPAVSFTPEPAAGARPQAPAANAAEKATETQERDDSGARAAQRLGTGHGRSETSRVELTRFERARSTPDQVLTIRYDRRANLIAMGIIAAPPPPLRPDPFPGALGFVPDPPRR